MIALGLLGGAEGLEHLIVLAELEEGGVERLLIVRRADAGDVRAGLEVRGEHVREVDVDDQVAVRHDDVVLTDLLQVGAHAGERLHLALKLLAAAVLAVVRERGQQAQPAVLAGHVPRLAVAQMVQQALIVAVQHDAHVGHAGVLHVGEHKVNDAIASAKGDRGGHAVLDQLPQSGLLLVRENDAVQSVHLATSFRFLLSI